MKNGLALFLESIVLAGCGAWTYYEIINESIPFEPIIVFITATALLIRAWNKSRKDEESEPKTSIGQPKILGANDLKTNPKEMVGRKGLLKELRNTMQQHGQVALINSMGGIGKTTLAEAYVYQFGSKYDHILWVEQTGEQLEDDFISDRTLLEHLGLNDPVEDK